MEALELIIAAGVLWNAGLQTLWFYRTKDKHKN
jgi:hypothetical protein